MTTLLASLWLALGILAGTLHAVLIWHTAHRGAALAPAAGMVRLLAVAALLIGAALAGGLLPACAAWGLGFLAAALVVLRSSGT